MSTIITHDMSMGMPKLIIYAPDSRTFVTSTDFEKWVIQIDGYAEKPFIDSVRFIDCIIVADDLSAFNGCLFDQCEMKVKEMPMSGFQSINNNRVEVKQGESNEYIKRNIRR